MAREELCKSVAAEASVPALPGMARFFEKAAADATAPMG
jgi:hypothetical protein